MGLVDFQWYDLWFRRLDHNINEEVFYNIPAGPATGGIGASTFVEDDAGSIGVMNMAMRESQI